MHLLAFYILEVWRLSCDNQNLHYFESVQALLLLHAILFNLWGFKLVYQCLNWKDRGESFIAQCDTTGIFRQYQNKEPSIPVFLELWLRVAGPGRGTQDMMLRGKMSPRVWGQCAMSYPNAGLLWSGKGVKTRSESLSLQAQTDGQREQICGV